MNGWGNCTNTPGSYYCNCSDFYTGWNCQTYQPRRHCADLYVYNDIKTSGPYLVNPDGTPSESVLVYCDMDTEGGGWTLVGNSAGHVNSGKTFVEYELGFGNANQQNGFIGLSWLHILTNSTIPMSLRVELTRCVNTASTLTYCTYPDFEVWGSETQYTVYIPEVCTGGNETNGIADGWIRWDPSQPGPKFYAFDNDVEGCSESFLHTGWWYNPKKRCGPANLNGIGFSCDKIPDLDDISAYMEFSGTPVASSQMYLRPKEFPDYDHS
uniref:Fibrinogen C-terminal domain-containing protein n=1 Tax=Acrobeloides nanus TaxID=290746 RepID=A0A914EPE1_9BILA